MGSVGRPGGGSDPSVPPHLGARHPAGPGSSGDQTPCKTRACAPSIFGSSPHTRNVQYCAATDDEFDCVLCESERNKCCTHGKTRNADTTNVFSIYDLAPLYRPSVHDVIFSEAIWYLYTAAQRPKRFLAKQLGTLIPSPQQ